MASRNVSQHSPDLSPASSSSSLSSFSSEPETSSRQPGPQRLAENPVVRHGEQTSRSPETSTQAGLDTGPSGMSYPDDPPSYDTAIGSAQAGAARNSVSPSSAQTPETRISGVTGSRSSNPAVPNSSETERGASRSRGHPPVKLLKAFHETEQSLPFAKEVEIKGWKIIGGKSWSDLGRLGAYVVYEIQVDLRTGGNITILRRYTDFVRLRSALKNQYPHLRQTIPPLPGKAHIAKFDATFLADRQPRLQRFLRTVMLHPEMGLGIASLPTDSGPNSVEERRSVVGQWVVDG